MNRHQRRADAKLNRTSNSPRAESAAGSLLPASAEVLQIGITHYRAGRLAEAESCYRRVLAIQPDHAGTHCNLGAVLQDQGKLDEAIAAYRQAIRISPHYALPRANLGTVLRKQGQLDEAIAEFRQAVRVQPDFAEAHFHLGIVLGDRRKLDEATAAFREAVRIKPDYAEAHCNLGIMYFDQGELDEAIASYRKAIRIKPDYAAAHFNLGIALCDQGKVDASIAAYREAIALKPNFADAHDGLGVALMQCGRFSEARESLQEAVRLVPDNARYRRGLSILAGVAVSDPGLAELEQLVSESSSRAIDDRIELHFALGKAYEDVGRYAEAFRQWVDGNALKRQQIAYDETTTLEELDRIRSVFTPNLVQTSQNVVHSSSLPVFIVGMPRSGTTLVEQILASHPRVFGGGELPYLKRAVERTLWKPGNSAAIGEDIHNLGARYLAEIERLAPGAAHITDKMPRNFIFSGLIHLALPNAPIIHTIRDPIDTCVSCFSILFTEEQNFAYNLVELGRYYRRYQDLMAHWHRVLPRGRILDIRYEDVVADLEGQSRRIIAHCGLEWDPRCLAFHQTERQVRTASAVQVRQPIYNSAIGRWRAYSEFLDPLLTELGIHAVSNA
jgi:tetratricopeptide (TPR) repeat protein